MIQSEYHAPFPLADYVADKANRRLIGRKFNDKDVQSDIKHFPFRVTNQNDKPAITVEVQGKDRSFSPEEISAMVLGKMKEIAESYLGKKVDLTSSSGYVAELKYF